MSAIGNDGVAMRRVRRPPAVITGVRESNAIAANLGRDAKRTRKTRRLTQEQLGEMVGLCQSEMSYLERGHGARTSIETWVAIGIALDRPIAIGFSRDVVEPLADAGHLAAQELLLRLATRAGWRGRFEVPSDPRSPGHSTDIVLERPGEIVLVEIWNRLDDLGAAVRSSDRKLAHVAATGRRPSSCWLLVDTAANRAIVRRYPTILRARFSASSVGWVRALVTGGPTPAAPGLAWIDVGANRLHALRSSSRTTRGPT